MSGKNGPLSSVTGAASQREWDALHAFVHNQTIGMNNMQLHLAAAHEAFDKVQKEKIDLEEAYEVLKASLLRAGERTAVTQGKLTAAEAKVSEADPKIKELEVANAALKKEIVDIETGSKTIAVSIDASTNKFTQRCAELEDQCIELKKRCGKFENQCDESEKKLTRSKVLDTVRIRDLNYAKEALEKSRSKNEDLETQIEVLEKKLRMSDQEARIGLSYANKHINEFEDKNVVLQNKNTQLEKSCSEKDGMIASLRSQITRSENFIVAREETIMGLKSEMAIWKNSLATKEEIITNLKSQNEILTNSNLDLATKLNSEGLERSGESENMVLSTQLDQAKTAIKNLEKQILELKNEIVNRAERTDELSHAHDSQNEVMENLIKEHENDLLVIENLNKRFISDQEAVAFTDVEHKKVLSKALLANEELRANNLALEKFRELVNKYEDYIPVDQMMFRKIESFHHQIYTTLGQVDTGDRRILEADTLAHILQRIIEEINTKTLYQQL